MPKKPIITGRAKFQVRTFVRSQTSLKKNLKVIEAHGYDCRGRNVSRLFAIGTVGLDRYMFVDSVGCTPRFMGKGYGHLLYWYTARRAKKLGFKGIKSDVNNRSERAMRAWSKIKTHSYKNFDYLNIDYFEPKLPIQKNK